MGAGILDSGAADFAEHMKRYADIGIVEVHVMPFDDPIHFIHGLGKYVVPAIRPL